VVVVVFVQPDGSAAVVELTTMRQAELMPQQLPLPAPRCPRSSGDGPPSLRAPNTLPPPPHPAAEEEVFRSSPRGEIRSRSHMAQQLLPCAHQRNNWQQPRRRGDDRHRTILLVMGPIFTAGSHRLWLIGWGGLKLLCRNQRDVWDC
jgi:hypothetical protein